MTVSAAVVPPDGPGVGVGEQGTGLAGGGLAGLRMDTQAWAA